MFALPQEAPAELEQHLEPERVLEYLRNHYPILTKVEGVLIDTAHCIATINQEICEKRPCRMSQRSKDHIYTLPENRDAILTLAAYYLRHGWDVSVTPHKGGLHLVRVVVMKPPENRLFLDTGILYEKECSYAKGRYEYLSGSYIPTTRDTCRVVQLP